MLLLHLPLTATASAAGYVYPLYASYKAITAPTRPASTAGQYTWRIPRAASSGPASARDDAAPVSGAAARTEMAEIETWLMYWSVLAVVQTLETFFGWSWSWLPLYDEGKLLFTLWLVLPQTRGASLLYTDYLAPFLDEHEQDIDKALIDGRILLKQSIIAAGQSAYYKAREVLWNIPPPPPPEGETSRSAPPSWSTSQGSLFQVVQSYVPASATDKARELLGVAGLSAATDRARDITRGWLSAPAPTSSEPCTATSQSSSANPPTTPASTGVSALTSGIFAPVSAVAGSAFPGGFPGGEGRSLFSPSAAQVRRAHLQRELAELDAQLAQSASEAEQQGGEKGQDETSHAKPTSLSSTFAPSSSSSPARPSANLTPTTKEPPASPSSSTPAKALQGDNPGSTSSSSEERVPAPASEQPASEQKSSFLSRWFSRPPPQQVPVEDVPSRILESEGNVQVEDLDVIDSAESTSLSGPYAVLQQRHTSASGRQDAANSSAPEQVE